MNLLLPGRLFLAMAMVDVIVFGGWITYEEVHRTGARIKLPVEGYDPRDLLSGHYVRFRLVAAREAQGFPQADSERIAVCLEQSPDGLYHATRLRQDHDGCAPFLAGQRNGTAIDFGVDRFYVDERVARTVPSVQAGAETYLLATIDSKGTLHALDLVVNGKSLSRHR